MIWNSPVHSLGGCRSGALPILAIARYLKSPCAIAASPPAVAGVPAPPRLASRRGCRTLSIKHGRDRQSRRACAASFAASQADEPRPPYSQRNPSHPGQRNAARLDGALTNSDFAKRSQLLAGQGSPTLRARDFPSRSRALSARAPLGAAPPTARTSSAYRALP